MGAVGSVGSVGSGAFMGTGVGGPGLAAGHRENQGLIFTQLFL
jgi:hypothetical protein